MATFTHLMLGINATFIANVLNYGANPAPGFMNTDAINAAIAAIEANGGGVLYFPPGTYLMSPVNLTSHMVSPTPKRCGLWPCR